MSRAKRCVWKTAVWPCGNGRCAYGGGHHVTRREVLRYDRARKRYWAGRHDWATLAVEMAAGCPF